jgi:transcriptional regulator with XRE-family HTH domain
VITLKPGTDLAALLCTLLDLSRVSPAELARRSGYADGQISKWRRGVVVPTAPVLLRLADVLGYDLTLTPRDES